MDAMGAHMAEPLKQSPLYETYCRVAPRVEDWPVLLDKTGELLRRDYDWSADLATITAPAMLVYADAPSLEAIDFYVRSPGRARLG